MTTFSQTAERRNITDSLKLLLLPGAVTELRILHTARGTVSGYFNDIGKLALAAAQWSGKAPAVYVTLNPVAPALLARAHNRLVAYARNTTSDIDIVRRIWLAFDFDPVRPAGISSTEAEHEAALARAKECVAWLRGLGFTALILADSGNGAHVLVRIDLPNDEASLLLVKKCLEAVALRFTDEVVALDLGVGNAARIWKAYGTLACKGDSTPDRPHRLAGILEVSDPLTPVSRELLEKLAALAPEEPKAETRQSYTDRSSLDLERWIRDHNLDVLGPHPWQGGRKWIFLVCPWNADHTNKAAFLVQFASGAIAAGCHHNGCHGKGWHDLRDTMEPGWRERRAQQAPGAATGQNEERPNPWTLAKDAPTFLAEEEKEFQGLAKDLVAPGAITLVAAPRGLGKSLVSHALAVALATGGVFRTERVQAARVLLVDRDNPEAVFKKRLRAWGAAEAPALRLLTRQNAPSLTDKAAWDTFPVDQYDVLIVDSVGSSTEGVTEREGKETTQVLATILDIARQGPGLLLLANCTKDALNLKGRGEWADRADIIFEVRDATNFTPSGKRPWWTELPKDGAADWAERAARRKGRVAFRLAFVPSKFRLGPEPDPFCLELSLPKDEPWTLRDVTTELIQAGEAAQTQAAQEKEDKQGRAAEALAKLVRERAEAGNPIPKTEAEKHLHEKEQLPRDDARAVISDYTGKLWQVKELEGRKGRPKALFPVDTTTSQLVPPKSDPPETPHESRAGEASVSAGLDSSGRENTLSQNPASNGASEGTPFSRPGKSTPAENDAQKTASNQACRAPQIFAADEVEKQPDSRDAAGFDWQTGQQGTPKKDSKVF